MKRLFAEKTICPVSDKSEKTAILSYGIKKLKKTSGLSLDLSDKLVIKKYLWEKITSEKVKNLSSQHTYA